jgi:hypothetical protein
MLNSLESSKCVIFLLSFLSDMKNWFGTEIDMTWTISIHSMDNVHSLYTLHGQCQFSSWTFPFFPWTMFVLSMDNVHSLWTMFIFSMDNVHSLHGHCPFSLHSPWTMSILTMDNVFILSTGIAHSFCCLCSFFAGVFH